MIWKELEITIDLDRDDARYRGGEMVEGTVHVEAGEDCECEALTVELEARAEGQTDGMISATQTAELDNLSGQIHIHDREAMRATLFSGKWLEGASKSYRFSLELPPGPYTYHGEMIDLDWYLRVEADIPWNVDPSMERTIRVDGGGATDHLYTDLPSTFEQVDLSDHDAPDYVKKYIQEKGLEELRRGVLGTIAGIVQTIMGLGIAALFGGYPIYMGIQVLSNNTVVGGILVGVGSIVAGGGLWMAYSAIQGWAAERALGDVTLRAEPETLHPGDTLEAEIEIQADDEGDIRESEFVLVGEEVMILSSGGSNNSSTRYTETIFEESVVPSEGTERRLSSGETVSLTRRVELTEDAPYSFHLGNIRLQWELRGRLDAGPGLEWTDSRPVVVRARPDEASDGVSSEASVEFDDDAPEW